MSEPIHVRPATSGWEVSAGEKILSRTERKTDAVRHARRAAGQRGEEYVLHRKDGSEQDRRHARPSPRSPYGQEVHVRRDGEQWTADGKAFSDKYTALSEAKRLARQRRGVVVMHYADGDTQGRLDPFSDTFAAEAGV